MPRIGKTPSIKFEHLKTKIAISKRKGRERWRPDFYIPGTNPPLRYTKSFPTLEAARAAAIAVINDAHNGIDVRTAHEMTVNGLGRLYIKEHHLLEGNSNSTVHNADLAFRRLSPILGDITLENLTTLDVVRAREAFRTQGLSVGTMQNYLRALRAALTWAKEKSTPPIISTNVALLAALPQKGRGKRRMYIPSPEVVAQVLDLQLSFPGTDEHLLHEVICEFLSETGARIHECLALQWLDIDRDNLTVTLIGGHAEDDEDDDEEYEDVSKTAESYRTITIDAHLLASLDRLLSRWRGPESLVFVKKDGVVISADTVRRRLRAIRKHLGLRKLHPHLFRHYHASRLLAEGEDLHYVKERLGHSSIKLTSDLYGHLRVGDRRFAADAANAKLRALRQPQRVGGPLPSAQDFLDDVERLLQQDAEDDREGGE